MQGDRLKELRKAAKLTQVQFAERLGITPQWLGKLERGDNPIEERIANAAEHAASPVHFYADARLAEDDAAELRRLLSRLARTEGDAETVGFILTRDGDLMRAMRRQPRPE